MLIPISTGRDSKHHNQKLLGKIIDQRKTGDNNNKKVIKGFFFKKDINIITALILE